VFLLVFVVQLFPARTHDLLFDILFTIIYFTATLTIDKYKKPFLVVAIILMALLWIGKTEAIPAISVISKFSAIIFFALMVFNFIAMIARSKEVNAKVILESINGYLLMGVTFSLLVALIMYFNPMAFKFPANPNPDLPTITQFGDYLYFCLVTMTTVGYGDITPVSSAAKSLSNFISVSGQLYIAIIIAMLVGKFASKTND
jgi:voltage-gated potassium channel Kch